MGCQMDWEGPEHGPAVLRRWPRVLPGAAQASVCVRRDTRYLAPGGVFGGWDQECGRAGKVGSSHGKEQWCLGRRGESQG